jgi:hypothetical protein
VAGTAAVTPRTDRFDICFSRAVNIVTKKKLAVRLLFGLSWLKIDDGQ